MTRERSKPARLPRLRAAWSVSAVVFLALGGGLGCVRTTSIGRGGSPPDADVERNTDAAADRDGPPPDLRTEAAVDQGPIVGGGRDASDGPDALDAGDTTDAP